MNQIAITFDQHRLVEQLIEAEMPKKQAEIFASTLHSLDVANKSDIEGVRGELQTQINGVKNDSAGARTESKADNTNLKAHTDGKFEAVEGKFAAIDGKFEGVNHKIDALRTEMKAGFKAVDNKFEAVHHKIESAKHETKAEIAGVETRLTLLIIGIAGLIIAAVGLMQYFF